MKSVIINLDPDTRAELYADVSNTLMDFILIEALTIALKDYSSSVETLQDAIADPEYYKNDPDTNIEQSIELLLDVLKELDRQDGEDVESPFYDVSSYSDWLRDKLCLAISSITDANTPLDFMMLNDVLTLPELSKQFNFQGKHLNNRVVMLLTGVDDHL